jgi:outer membrane lipoprotein SlyB
MDSSVRLASQARALREDAFMRRALSAADPALKDLAMNNSLLSAERTYSIVTMAATVCAAVLVLAACGPNKTDATKGSDYAATQTTLPSRSTSSLPRPAPQPAPVVAQAPVPRADMGRISSIETISTPGKTNGSGALIGGVLGAAVGNQVGHGNGKAVGTGLGAVGGAVLGSEIERRNKPATVSYRIHVRLDNGDSRSFDSANNDGLRIGDRVQVDGSVLRRA